MQSGHTTYLGLKELPRELSAFELQAFFAFSRAERAVIDARHVATYKLGLARQMGFLRLSVRSLNAVRVVPLSLCARLRKEPGVRAPELASLKALYGRRRTLFEHQQLAEQTLGFRGMTGHQNRAFVQVLRSEAAALAYKYPMLVFARRWLYDHRFLIESERAVNTQITTALELIETQTGETIAATLPGDLLDKWRCTLSEFRANGRIQWSDTRPI